MAKRVVAKVGTYQKDGQEKGEYVKVGVILTGGTDNSEFILFDPTINMAGIAYKQRVNGIVKPDSDTVIASIFTDEPKQNAPQKAAEMSENNQEFNDSIPF